MKITDSKSLGRAIRARRKELNYTQAYVSGFTGFSVTFISDLERGKPTAEIEKTIRLIYILGMDLLVERRWNGTNVIKSQCVLNCANVFNNLKWQKAIIRAENKNQIDISLEFLYNLSKMKNAIFKGEIYEV